MSADDAYLQRAERFVREQAEQLEGPVVSVSCTAADGGGASCEVVFGDGRTAMCAVDVEGRGFAYFVSPAPTS